MDESVWTAAKTYYEDNIAEAKRHLEDLQSGDYKTERKDGLHAEVQDDTGNLAAHYERTITMLEGILREVNRRIAEGPRVGNG